MIPSPSLLQPSGSRRPLARRRVLAASLAGAALVALGTSCKKPTPPPPPPPVVQFLSVTATNVPHSGEFIGQIDSPQNVEVRARVEAFVDQILFTEGTPVKEGDPLFGLDKRPYEQQLAAANGALAEARAALRKYQADVARLRPLADLNAIPRQDLDNAVASVAVGEANVQSAEARVQSARLNLEYCDVRAPISGLIGARQVSLGTLVGKGQPTLMATVSQLNPIWFYTSISEVDYLRSQRRLQEAGVSMRDVPVTLVLGDGSQHPEKGKWVFLDRAVDPTTGTIRARAEFQNPAGVLRPGMFARAQLSVTTDRPSILIPEKSVVELQGRSFVWLIDQENKAHQTGVEVDPHKYGDQVLVVKGLQPGQRLVIEGLQKLREGSPVRPMTAEEIARAAAPASKQSTGQGKE